MVNPGKDVFGRSSGSGHPQSQTVTVSRSRCIAAPPSVVFAALANPSNLAGLLPRIKQVELLEQTSTHARIATHMQITPFNTIRTEGKIHWETDREIVFTTKPPMSIETRIALQPHEAGTQVDVTLTLELSALLGPLAAFVPHDQVANVAAPDLEATLTAIARAVEKR